MHIPRPVEIQQYRERFQNHSRSGLIEEMQTYVTHSPQHIAAKQLLDELDQEESDRKHEEGLKVQKAAIVLSVIAIVVSVVSLLLSIFK